MGRHTAPDDESVDPVVAAALARRTSDPSGAHRGDDTQRIDTQSIAAALGWPEDPHEGGGGLGWPGDLTPEATGSGRSGEESTPSAPTGLRRRGWRRLFGHDRAA